MPSPSSVEALQQAQANLNEAQAALDLEANRIGEAQAEVEKLTEEIRTTDPADAVGFAGWWASAMRCVDSSRRFRRGSSRSTSA